MLPDWMIDAIKKQKEEQIRQEDAARPRLEIPLYPPVREEEPKNEPEEPKRGVIVIDFSV